VRPSRRGSPRRAGGLGAAGDAPRTIEHGPLGERLGYILRRAQLAIFEDFIAACSVHDIRPAQYSALTIIERNPGLSQTKVAEALGIKKPNFVAMVDELEHRGLVRRDASPGDRRSHALFLTDEGRLLIRKLHQISADHEQRIVDLVGPRMHKRMFSALAAIATMGSPQKSDE
jgi:DNA-binding MarR family transcriptional regulator